MYANRFISIVSSSPPDRPILSNSGGHLTVGKVTAVGRLGRKAATPAEAADKFRKQPTSSLQ